MAVKRSRRSILALGLGVTFLYAGLDWIQGVEVVTLRAKPLGNHEHFARVFVVDDPPFTWIRAERPDRFWLEAIRAYPHVNLQRGGRDVAYEAIVWNGQGRHGRVDALFREKYGVLDALSAWVSGRDPVPIRLIERSL